LSSLSWFLGRLNESIARRANQEDEVKGRFWESRFKCQALLDEAAVAAAMVYVDLNPIRARLADTPEASDFTSIQERIRAWQQETTRAAAVPAEIDQEMALAEDYLPLSEPMLRTEPPSTFLCPIPSDAQRRGILGMTTLEYIDLVDRSGRLVRQHKRGAMDPDLAPILMRIGANPRQWHDTVSRFGSKFQVAAGLVDHLRSFAGLVGRRWLKGMGTARMAFVSQPCL
jgi:hypothetical protein